MEQILEKIGVQLPVATIVVFVVWMFLKHLKEEREVMKQFHQDHLQSREESRLAIKDCADSNRELIRCIQKFEGK